MDFSKPKALEIKAESVYNNSCQEGIVLADYTRVKRIIRDTFLEMLAQKGFNNISVKDILEKAQVSKSGFYFHYEDKYDLLRSIEDEFLSDMKAAFETVRVASSGVPLTSASPHAAKCYAKYFECIEKNEDLFLLLISDKGSGYFIFRFASFIQEEQKKTRSAWGAQYVIPDYLLDYLTTATSYAYAGIFVHWAGADHETRPSPIVMGDAMSHIFRQEHHNL